MDSFHAYIDDYKKQMKKGDIPKAYQGLMGYMMSLRTYFKNTYPDYFVPGNIYYGYMDMTYFPILTESLKKRKLKIAIVFVHETFRFEVWLAAANKQVQSRYWDLFKRSGWKKYKILSSIKGEDSIIEYILDENPDFSDLETLTKRIDKGATKFIKDIESFLEKY